LSLSAEERVLRARIAAHTLHAKGGTNTGPAKAAFEARFEREVDPEGILDPEERQKRAQHARAAYFLRLSLAGVKAKREKREQG
jgi:hypothetical protein